MRFIPDDDHNEPSFTFHEAFSQTPCMPKRLTAAPHVRQPTALGSVPSSFSRGGAATKEERRALITSQQGARVRM